MSSNYKNDILLKMKNCNIRFSYIHRATVAVRCMLASTKCTKSSASSRGVKAVPNQIIRAFMRGSIDTERGFEATQKTHVIVDQQ